MHAELLTIGSELLNGATVNTNATYLARRLAEVGIPCRRQMSVADEPQALREALREALARCDVLVTTGGLGPTFDDVTMAVIAEATGRSLRHWPSLAARIRRFYRRHHRALQRAALRQASLPRGAVPIPNPIGTAPGIWLALDQTLLIALPGVPSEMRAMMERSVLPRLRRIGQGRSIESRTIRTAGLVELSIEALLRGLRLPPTIQVGLYPNLRLVDVRLTASGRSVRAVHTTLRRAEAALRQHLGEAVYGVDEETLEEILGRLLLARRKTLAVAESCTGGQIGDRLTSVSGSSRYLRGAIVAYHNDLKRKVLGVSDKTLARFGAVSAPVAKQMARGVRRMAGADIGLAVTGIAGPTGGSATKPVGLIYLALADGRRAHVQRHQCFGDRASIKSQAAQAAIDWLRRVLLKSSGKPSTVHGP